MNIFSAFDGMSCGRIACEKIGIKVDKYYASEIKPCAIKVSKHNYPDIIHVGDITKVSYNKNEIGFVTGNIIKYIVRYKNKNGIEDLKKAKEYLGRRHIENLIIDSEDKLKFYEENNLNYKQGIILDLVLDNCHKKAEEMLNSLIKYEEKKIKEIEETYQTEGMAD